jgi:hypothetical protein
MMIRPIAPTLHRRRGWLGARSGSQDQMAGYSL